MLSIQDSSLCCCSPWVLPPFRGSLWCNSIYRFRSDTTLANRWLCVEHVVKTINRHRVNITTEKDHWREHGSRTNWRKH
jgi:hypothetical protein